MSALNRWILYITKEFINHVKFSERVFLSSSIFISKQSSKHHRWHAKNLKQNETVKEQAINQQQAQTISEQNQVIEKQKLQIELKDNTAKRTSVELLINFNRK